METTEKKNFIPAPEGYRWVTCDKDADWGTSQRSHLLPIKNPGPYPWSGDTTMCGASGSGEGVWHRSRKEHCKQCIEAYETMMKKPIVKPEPKPYILNGAGNGVTAVRVVSKADGITTVERLVETGGKRGVTGPLNFDTKTRLAIGDEEQFAIGRPSLTDGEDPRVRELLRRRSHHDQHDHAQRLLSAFHRTPTTTTLAELTNFIHRWANHSVGAFPEGETIEEAIARLQTVKK